MLTVSLFILFDIIWGFEVEWTLLEKCGQIFDYYKHYRCQ